MNHYFRRLYFQWLNRHNNAVTKLLFLDLSRLLQKTEENLKSKTADYDELEVAIDKLRTELTKTEQAKKELHHQVCKLHFDNIIHK